jgi:hypothetical protein
MKKLEQIKQAKDLMAEITFTIECLDESNSQLNSNTNKKHLVIKALFRQITSFLNDIIQENKL